MMGVCMCVASTQQILTQQQFLLLFHLFRLIDRNRQNKKGRIDGPLLILLANMYGCPLRTNATFTCRIIQ
jgi:hypothetical protein